MVLSGPLQLRIFCDSIAPVYCSASVLYPLCAVMGARPGCRVCGCAHTRLAPTGMQFLQTLGFCLSALVSTSDGYFNSSPFLNKKKGLELRTEGLWCVSLCCG